MRAPLIAVLPLRNAIADRNRKEALRQQRHATIEEMPQFSVATPQRGYTAVVERGAIARLPEFLPSKHGRVFVVTEQGVWNLHGARVTAALRTTPFDTLFFAGGEGNKRMAHVEQLAEQMAERGADRSSLVIAFGGGIVTDLGGFLAAIYMRGIPVIQIPTTLLAQVDAALGGKTGGNLTAGKNLIGSFHQPLAVLVDSDVLSTLPENEYRAGLYEVIKHGVIKSEPLFRAMESRRDASGSLDRHDAGRGCTCDRERARCLRADSISGGHQRRSLAGAASQRQENGAEPDSLRIAGADR